ncbi:hypothetical protein LTR10_011979 [Elasticomyces elasticus]|nr:hypothetical protein LTR10_011979 [Elasticomyces elasticus]
MLPRTLSRPLAQYALVPATLEPCTKCVCACGNVVRNQYGVRQEKRQISMRKAPATYNKQRRERIKGLSLEEAKRQQKYKDLERNFYYNVIDGVAKQAQNMIMTAESGSQFIADFNKLASEARGKNVVDLERFGALVQASGIPWGEMDYLQQILMHRSEDRYLGKKLLFTMSANGREESTIRVCNHALSLHKIRPQALRASEIAYERGRLKEIARKGENFRAMVLEGKIARVLNDEEYAIALWEQAMDAAVEKSEREAALRSQQKQTEELATIVRQQARDELELSSPWIDLTLIRYDRSRRFYQHEYTRSLMELDKAKAAMEIGCKMDDPTSHFHAAEWFGDVYPDGMTKYTSSWLFNMTKAAASVHPKAAYLLAKFYATSAWKYIDDEPPDHVKPTPFDSYPASPEAKSERPGFLSTVQNFFGFSADGNSSRSQSTAKPSDEVFHTAAFPSAPKDRLVLAHRWLQIAINRYYAPAYLFEAELVLQRTLWSDAQAPASAIAKTDERYSYDSKDDYEAGKMREGKSEEPEAIELRNDLHDPNRAKQWLVEIFYAVRARDLRRRMIADAQSPRKRQASSVPADLEDIGSENDYRKDKYPPGTPWHVTKWLADHTVREMYEHELDGLLATVKAICDDRGWDVVDELGDGGLLYKARKVD